MYSRLTTATMYGSLMDSLSQSQRNIQDLQKQIASGNKYTKLSDNPSAISRSLALQSALNANDKYQSNTTNGITMLRYADSALNNVLDAVQSIRSLVIQAGDGALNDDQLQDITAQIEANKKIMMDNLNTKVAGQYLFGGTDTSTKPFVEMPDGSIVYQGTDERIKYAVSESLLGDVSFAGSDIVPENENSYFICSHKVGIDWTWQGREEKVQITVGNRTLSVFIPEDWKDSDYNKTNKYRGDSTKLVNYSDADGYRDPGELTGISLQDLADIVNSSLEEQGADMLVQAYIETDEESRTQQLFLKSNTGEKIGITGWPDTDYMPMEAETSTIELDESWKPSWVATTLDFSDDWKPSGSETSQLKITVGSSESTVAIESTDTAESLKDKINAISGVSAKLSDDGKRIIINKEQNDSTLTIKAEGNATKMFNFKDGETTLIAPAGNTSLLRIAVGNSSPSTLNDDEIAAKSDDELAKEGIVRITDSDTIESVAEKIKSINGVFARTSADGKKIVITAERIGDLPEDRLRIDEAKEALHYPSLTIKAEGNAKAMFQFEGSEDTLIAKSETRKLDQSHMDVFDVLGMETAMKSREFGVNEVLTVEPGEQLHWRVISGGHTVDIKLNEGTYGLDELASRLKNAGAGWLEVTLSEDVKDDAGLGTFDGEEKTQRIVMRGFNGEQVLFLDMNENHYADRLGLSTALRTDGYNEKTGYVGRGMKCVNFPSAPCVDDNVGVPMRVQMNCGMYYDVNIKRADVINKETGFVDRSLVMKSIVDQVNEIEGEDIMGFVQHVDAEGKEIPESSSIYFLSGEAFTVVDMPFDDPEWNDYSGGLAAQMGIHGGVTSNLQKTVIPMKDSRLTDSGTFEDAYTKEGLTFREGTIRFSNLSHSVEIDVSATDTVKDVMDRLRTQAGDWLYINYYDTHMGQADMRNTGDYPIISISSIDGSAVNILDVKGHIAEDALGLSTGVQGRINEAGTGKGLLDDTRFAWDINAQNFPADALNITVAGYTHTIDLTALRDVTADDKIMADDIVKFVNARMQDYDVQAEINKDGEFMMWSPRGYSIKAEFMERKDDSYPIDYNNFNAPSAMIDVAGKRFIVDLSEANNADERKDAIIKAFEKSGITAEADEDAGTISFKDADGNTLDAEVLSGNTSEFLGADTSLRSYYRGGYNLEESAKTRGINGGFYDDGIHAQNATIRSGANTMKQNGFGVINDIIAAVESGNRDDIADKMLPRIDDFISNILSVMAENGALQARYNYNNERLIAENAVLDEQYDDVAKIDPADAISQLMIADYMYQANLAVISRLIQPSLLDFLH